MANYGLQTTPSQIPFTGYSNTLGGSSAAQGATSGYVYANGLLSADSDVAREFRNGGQVGAVNRILYALLGAAVGGNATKTKAQVQHVVGAPGGLIPIETITLVNRNTTAADLTAVQAIFNRTVFPATYVVDVGGNGGGGKAGI
jgi:hypothetical protein